MSDSLRDQVSNIVGMHIPPKGWRQKFSEMDKAGMIDNRMLIKLVIILLEHMEASENAETVQPTL